MNTDEPFDPNRDLTIDGAIRSLTEKEQKKLRMMITYSEHTPKTGDCTGSYAQGAALTNTTERDFMARCLKMAHLGLVEITRTFQMEPGEDSSAEGEVYGVAKRLTPFGVHVARRLVERDGLPEQVSDVMPEYG